MSKGKAQVNYLGREGIVGLSDAPDYGFIYEASLVKDPKWNLGDRVVLPDGREYRYGKSASAVITSEACYFTDVGYTAYTAMAVAAAVGDKVITIPAATHAVLTKDELRGGYVRIVGTVTDNGDGQFRGIIGNDAAVADAAFKVYLDGPLTQAITTNACEVFQNPYGNLTHSTGAPMFAKAGVPATYCSASGYYFWVQVKGPVFVTPQDGVVGNNESKGAFWRDDGSIDSFNTAIGITDGAYDSTQYAGYCIMGSASGNGPLFMLQG